MKKTGESKSGYAERQPDDAAYLELAMRLGLSLASIRQLPDIREDPTSAIVLVLDL